MLSGLREKLIGCLVGVVAFGVIGCGGKASSDKGGIAGGGAGGVFSSAGAAGADAPGPSTVQVNGNDEGIDLNATPECLQGFQGFAGQVEGVDLDFKAFVSMPGDYEGDPVRILWLEAVRTDNEHYLAAAGTAESSGSISLHVEQVEEEPVPVEHVEVDGHRDEHEGREDRVGAEPRRQQRMARAEPELGA